VIELALPSEGRAPKKRVTTVKRTTFKPHAPEGKVRPLTAAERTDMLQRGLGYIRGELQDGLKAFHNQYTDLAYDLKESERQRELVRKTLSDFGTRLAAVEKQMKVATATFTLDQMRAAGLELPDMAAPPRLDHLSVWQAKIDAAVERIEKELPVITTPTELATFYKVNYTVIANLMTRGRLAVTRDGRNKNISRESVIAYVRVYGVPCMKRHSHGGTE